MYILNSIRNNFKTKSYGFYVALAPFVVTIVYSIMYLLLKDKTLFNVSTVIWGFAGCGAFLVLTMFSETSKYAPIVLVAANLFGLVGIAEAENFIDYITTVFFGGFSLEVLFSIDPNYLVPLVGSVLSLIISCVAMYLPQNKKQPKEDK